MNVQIHVIYAALAVFAMPLGAIADDVDFDAEIKPLLSDRCFRCHGPDSKARQADLRLDLEDSAKATAIVPGQPQKSKLFQRITSNDPDMHMPPADSKLALSTDEVELIRRWIAEGAKWKEHWSFSTPRPIKPPAVMNSAWCRNDIDRFILWRIEQAGLTPATEAPRQKLIRRLSFDLIGLPPSLAEIDAFLDDADDAGYERLVDRLLKSPHFGERMASDWLDVARYSDTYGYQVDRDRFVWPWRDWVIRAFNRNMPYDQFVTEQLAGDLLPNATDDQVLATTFNRLHPQKVEGGSTPEEFRIEYVSDRTQTFATAFLGLTLECCRCHDHKYDPFSQKEYYQFTAFFDNIAESGLYSYFTPSVPTPTLLVMDDAVKGRIAKIKQELRRAEIDLTQIAEKRRPQFAKWHTATKKSAKSQKPEMLIPDRVAFLDFEGAVTGANQSVAGRNGQAIKLSGDDAVGLKVGNFRRFDPFSVALWINTPDVKQRAVVFHRSRAWTDAGSRGYQLLIEDGRLSASLIHFWPGNAIRIRMKEQLATNSWQHVAVTWDGASRANGLRLFVNGNQVDCDVVADNLYKNITGGGGNNIAIGERFRDRGFTNGLVDDFMVYSRELSALEIKQLGDGKSLTDALTSSLDGIDKQTAAGLYAYYLAIADADYRQQLKAVRALRQQLSQAVDGLPEIMVMRENAARQTYLLKRGSYDARLDPVRPETPAILPEFPKNEPRNRLGLARWVTRAENPLAARVAVNRIWQMVFGEGLVRTPEDFGRQGQPPTHPELLDWLASDFAAHGWDVKRLLKQLVMSATYRQSSVAKETSLTRDPRNRLLSWSPSHRLPAEMLRDNALAVSGLLVRKQGGPPVKPYEVEASFKPARRDKGEGLYRRSLYTYWKRTGPAPVMMTLDASKRDVCRVRREHTSTPLEAFVLMNGPQFVEASRVLSQKLMTQHTDDVAKILTEMFRVMTSRSPTAAEHKILTGLYRVQLDYFRANAGRAKSYLAIGDSPADRSLNENELAALASVSNALFSFDEVLNRR